jgi:signal peptide peptidase SppA
MAWFRKKPVVPVVRLVGAIGVGGLRPGLSLAGTAEALEKAFTLSKLPAVVILVNSPGGSPVQSNLIFGRIRSLAAEHKKKVYVFAEDVAASGGYFLSVAGDEIYADPSSIIGSIGVISASFGLDKAIKRFDVERRVYTAGTNKGALDPFQPEKPEDVALIKGIQKDIHDVFIGVVKERRAGKLKEPDSVLFSGAFWSAKQALEFGLIDGVTDPRTKMRELFGAKVQLRLVPLAKPSLISRLRGAPAGGSLGVDIGAALPGAALETLEERALWARFGL